MPRCGIVASSEQELAYLYEKYPAVKEEHAAGWTFRLYSCPGFEAVSAVSGVGKVRAAACTQLLIARYNPDEMYMSGICGGLSRGLKGLDLVVAAESIQHDVRNAGGEESPFDHDGGRRSRVPADPDMLGSMKQYCETKRVNAAFGVVATGDSRIDSAERCEALQRQYNAIAADQELAAFYHVSCLNRVRFLAVKAVSDMADGCIAEDQRRFLLEACRRANAVLLDFIAYRHGWGDGAADIRTSKGTEP